MRQQFKQRAHALALFYGPSEQKRDQYETPRNTQKTLQNLPISHYLRAASDSVRDDFLSFCMTFFGDSIEIFLLVYCSCFVPLLLLLLDFYAFFFSRLQFFSRSLSFSSFCLFHSKCITHFLLFALATVVVDLFIICFHLAASIVRDSFCKI